MPCRMRVYQYYLPIYFWMREQLERHKASTDGQQRPLTIGMQAPQVTPVSNICHSTLHLLSGRSWTDFGRS